MDFLRLSQFSSFIETIPVEHFDINSIVGKKRCAMGWAGLFDDRVVIADNGLTVMWVPTKDQGYLICAANLFDISTTLARQLFRPDVQLKLHAWVKTPCNSSMTPKEMGQRIRDFVEYYQANPEPEPPTPTEHAIASLEFIEAEEVISQFPEEWCTQSISETLDQPDPEPEPRRLTPREILGL